MSILVIGNFNKKQINFGSIDKEVKNSNNELLYRNNTMPYRFDLPIKRAIKDITQRETPPKIYCYACSDGSEAYTIALELLKKLGKKGAKPFFPIIARDKDKDVIKIAKSHKIGLDKEESDYITSKIGKKLFKQFFGNPHPCKKRDLGRDTYYNVKKGLAQCVNFEVGDIVQDAPNIDYRNSVIFCRNVWPYIEDNTRENLFKTFKSKFTDSTTLIIGEFDYADERKAPLDIRDELYTKSNLIETSPKIFKTVNKKHTIEELLDSFYRPIGNICELGKSIVLSLRYAK